METETLYLDTEFGKWLDNRPSNVETSYSEFDVDMQGNRVTITFTIEEE